MQSRQSHTDLLEDQATQTLARSHKPAAGNYPAAGFFGRRGFLGWLVGAALAPFWLKRAHAGQIDSLQVWDRRLAEWEIKALAANSKDGGWLSCHMLCRDTARMHMLKARVDFYGDGVTYEMVTRRRPGRGECDRGPVRRVEAVEFLSLHMDSEESLARKKFELGGIS